MNSFHLACNGRNAFLSKSLILGLALLCVAAPSFATTVVVPNSMETTEGNIDNTVPFGWYTTLRYQQVYGAADFAALTGPGLITHIRFRPDSWYGPNFELAHTDIQISLSTTAANPDGLSLTFANNVGGDNTTVFSGPLVLSGSGAPVVIPRTFNIEIELQEPFLYDPSLGNLLLDVTTFDPEPWITASFDAQDDSWDPTADAVSRVWYFDWDNGTSPQANLWDSMGLVTQFEIAPAGPGVTELDMDIMFCKSPNSFNCKTKGPLQSTLFGTGTFDVADIDPATLQLCLEDLSACTGAPANFAYDDRGNPLTDLGAGVCAVNPETLEEEDFLNQDGFFDMNVVFEAEQVQAILGDFCAQDKGAISDTLVIIGSTFDGDPLTSVAIGDTGVDQLVKQDKLKPVKDKGKSGK